MYLFKIFRVAEKAGFSLVEVTIAVGIAAFCLISIIGLLSAGFSANKKSLKTTEAAGIVEALFADLRSAPEGLNSFIYGINPNVDQVTTRYLDRTGQEKPESAADLRLILTVDAPSSGIIAPSFIRAEIVWPPGVANSPNKFEAFTMIDRD